MNDLVEVGSKKIVDLIYEVRGKQVMLDNEISRIKCHRKDASYE